MKRVHARCQPIPGEPVHDSFEAARLLGIRPMSVRSAVRDGLLGAWQPGGWKTALLFPQSAIEEYLARPSVLAARKPTALSKLDKAVTPSRRRGPLPLARLSIDPLLELAAQGMVEPNAHKLAVVLGCASGDIWRWLAGGVTWTAADRLAVRLGYHPAEVWGADWWALDDVETPDPVELAAAVRRHPSTRFSLVANETETAPLHAA